MVANIAPDDGQPPSLYASVSGLEHGPVALLLHGLFGMGSNLGGLARALSSHFRVHQLDLPNHGRSSWQDPMTIPSLAEAVRAYAVHAEVGPVAVVGHSLGGKVAMELALKSPDIVSALVVADIAPIAYAGSHDEVFAAIAAVTNARPRSRREAGEIMEPLLEESAVAQFLLLSLQRDDQGYYQWRFNAEGLKSNYAALLAAPAASLPFAGPTLFVYGENSPYVRAPGIAAAREKFTDSHFLALANAGHWLHVEQPDLFNASVSDFLRAELIPATAQS